MDAETVARYKADGAHAECKKHMTAACNYRRAYHGSEHSYPSDGHQGKEGGIGHLESSELRRAYSASLSTSRPARFFFGDFAGFLFEAFAFAMDVP